MRSSLSYRWGLETKILGHDFIQPGYNNTVPHPQRLKRVFVLLSTPRSGSTLLCQKILENTGIVCHEYLQPYQYMPSFFQQYGGHICNDSVSIDLREYLQHLVALRAKKSVLAINLHVSHLGIFEVCFPLLRSLYGDISIARHGITRKDLLMQSISYWRARREKTWSKSARQEDSSSTFSLEDYSYNEISRLRMRLSRQRKVIKSLHEEGVIQYLHEYEDFCRDSTMSMRKISEHLGFEMRNRGDVRSEREGSFRLKKQRDELNVQLASRFRSEDSYKAPFSWIANQILSHAKRFRNSKWTGSRGRQKGPRVHLFS